MELCMTQIATSGRRDSKRRTKRARRGSPPGEAAGTEASERSKLKRAEALARQGERVADGLAEAYVAGNTWGLKELRWVAHGLVARLATLAECGDPEAANVLVFVVRHGVRRLDSLADAQPNLLRINAGLLDKWPGFLCLNREEERKNKERIRRLGVGSWMGINYEGKTWSAQTAEVKVALELEGDVGRIRHGRVNGELAKRMGAVEPPESAWALADGLRPLSRENYGKWWKAAEPLFMQKYGPAFEDRPEFKHYWRNAVYRDERNARALIRRDIKAKIKQAFRTIAAKRPRSPEEQPFRGETPPVRVREIADAQAWETVARLKVRELKDARLAKKVSDLRKAGAMPAGGGRAAT